MIDKDLNKKLLWYVNIALLKMKSFDDDRFKDFINISNYEDKYIIKTRDDVWNDIGNLNIEYKDTYECYVTFKSFHSHKLHFDKETEELFWNIYNRAFRNGLEEIEVFLKNELKVTDKDFRINKINKLL